MNFRKAKKLKPTGLEMEEEQKANLKKRINPELIESGEDSGEESGEMDIEGMDFEKKVKEFFKNRMKIISI